MSNTMNNKSVKGSEQSLSERRPRSGKKTLVLSNAFGNDELGDKARDRTAWSDPALTKKRLSSPLLTPDGSQDDPFAGMNSSINYQQEIERLKALVPKGDPKKRTPSRPRSTAFESASSNKSLAHTKSKSQTFSSASSSSSSSAPNAGSRRTPASPLSRSRPQSAFCISADSRASTPSSSTFFGDAAGKVVSPMATPRSLSPARSDHTSMAIHTVPEEDEDSKVKEQISQSVISEEEKNRFLEFMRSWTGGLREWSHVDAAVDTASSSGSSLWTQQTP